MKNFSDWGCWSAIYLCSVCGHTLYDEYNYGVDVYHPTLKYRAKDTALCPYCGNPTKPLLAAASERHTQPGFFKSSEFEYRYKLNGVEYTKDELHDKLKQLKSIANTSATV